ncbi:MAG TPA: shikimate dehydrogenase [Paludibacter sp.]|nr:MAG: Shikimate dehydrogenase [Bacteroidetes bacterium ADurb.Bin174]HQB28879.1 shikimate dehydrogenase [Paludibacter sp.]
MKYFGIIGFPLHVSFSRDYFTNYFRQEKMAAQYDLYPLKDISEFPALVQARQLSGLNVTIPYKQQVIPYLDELDDTAAAIGAVNVIKFMQEKRGKSGNTKLKGYNSDVIGFSDSIRPFLQTHHAKALILGTGGASKAVDYGLRQLGLQTRFVSRKPTETIYGYTDLTEEIIQNHQVIVNTTPLGMSPNVEACPNIPYEFLTNRHLLYDVIYTPEETLFLKKGKERGCVVVNGLEMLYGQARAAWKIWND